MADYWMKLYIEILDDPKMATLPDRIWRRIIELFLIAKRQGKNGHLPDTRQLAWILRMNADELESDMTQIAQTRIVIQEIGGWFIPKFEQRQAAVSDAERMKQMRDRQQKRQYYDDVTNQLRNITQSTEAESETETETKAETKAEEETPHLFDQFQRACEKRGILITGTADIEGITGLIKAGAEICDLEAGITWKVAHNNGKAVVRLSQVTNPTITAMSIRKNGKRTGKHDELEDRIERLLKGE